MFGCLTGSLYNMSADLYRQTKTTDRSGQVVRSWAKLKTFECYATQTSSGSTSNRSGAMESWDKKWYYEDSVRIKTQESIKLGDRIYSISDASGNCVWNEEDNDPTIFDVTGIVPVVSAFGEFREYDVLLSRAEVQKFA